MDDAELPPVEELLPHRGEMMLLERLLAHDGESTTAQVSSQRRWLRAPDGSVPGWLALEYMAQCAAAHEGMLARAEGRPIPRGVLIAGRRLRLRALRLGSDEALLARARRAAGRPELGAISYHCTVHREGGEADPLVEGRLSVAVGWPGEAAKA